MAEKDIDERSAIKNLNYPGNKLLVGCTQLQLCTQFTTSLTVREKRLKVKVVVSDLRKL